MNAYFRPGGMVIWNILFLEYLVLHLSKNEFPLQKMEDGVLWPSFWPLNVNVAIRESEG